MANGKKISLVARPFEKNDCRNVVSWMTPTAYDLFLVSSRFDFPLSENEFMDYFNSSKSSEAHLFFSVVYNNEHIGHFELKNINRKHLNGTIAHVLLSPEWRGQKLGVELVKLIVQTGFGQCQLERLTLAVHTVNIPAVTTYIKTGFIFEGNIPNALIFKNKRYSIYQMSIFRKDHACQNED